MDMEQETKEKSLSDMMFTAMVHADDWLLVNQHRGHGPDEEWCLIHELRKCIVKALQPQRDRENPKPLTLEELKGRYGKPVWRECLMARGWIFLRHISNEPNYLIRFVDSRGFLSKTSFDSEKFYDHELPV